MTDEHGRGDPDAHDELADSFGIDEAADEHPRPSPNASPQGPPDVAPHDPSSVPHSAPHSAPPPGPPSPEPPSGPSHRQPSGAPEPEAGNRPKRRRERKPHRKAPWWELPALIALAVLIAILVKTFLVQPFYIPSESMEKTLHGCPGCSGDRILVNKVLYNFRDPHPGDIVVFNAPPGWDDEPPSVPPSNPILRTIRGFGQLIGFVPPDGMVLVKRVIATGGQSVKGDADGNVYLSNSGTDGPWRKLNEPYVYETGTDPRAKFGPITVPKGRLWVMGDHRNRSADSRYHCGLDGGDGPDNASCDVKAATVPDDDVIGKAVVIVWPPSRWTTLGTPKTFTNAAASGAVPALVVLPLFMVRRVRGRRRRRRR